MSLLELIAPKYYDRQTDRMIATRQARVERDMRTELRFRWITACERPELRLSHGIITPGGGMGPGRAPLVREITIGDAMTPTTFVVELRPGQVLEDLEDAGQELAAALSVHRLAFDALPGGDYVRVTMIEDDPHAEVIEAADLYAMAGVLTLGPDEYGHPIRLPFGSLPHVACQGTTGAGKSTALYWIMRQILGQPGVRLAGVDPSGLIFRPLPADPWRVSGLANPRAAVDALAALCDEMDRRIAAMPWDDDKLPCGPDEADPWLFVIMEELPGLLAAITAAVDKATAERCRLYLGRLAAESRKAGMRLLMAAQRFAAQDTAGATVRGNAGLRVSFRVENRASVDFLHEDAPADIVAEHLHAPAGVALVSAPGHPVRRTRFPAITYRQWAHYAASIYGAPVAA